MSLLTQIATFISTNELVFRFIMIALEILFIIFIYVNYTKYRSRHKDIDIIEFSLNLFFTDSVNPLPGFTDFFWVPIATLVFGLQAFIDITWGQLIIYELATAIIGILGFRLVLFFYGRTLDIHPFKKRK